MKLCSKLTLLLAALAVSLPATGEADSADIYWIDVEGGAATLVVTEAGETVLMDSGWAGFDDRDAKRIELVAEVAGVERIDYLITSHFHRDHAGGLAALARRMEIGQFLDHGDSVQKDSVPGLESWRN